MSLTTEPVPPLALRSGSRVPLTAENRRGYWWAGSFLLLTLATGIGIFLPVSAELVATFVIINMVCLLFLRVPLAVSMFVPSLLGLWAVRSVRLPMEMMMTLPLGQMASWSLSVIPMYILMGLVLSHSGIATDLYRAIAGLMPRLPGNLAVASNLAGSGMATVSGSTLTTVLAMLRVGLPEMLRAGYDRRYAMGAVIVAGLAGPLMPLSVLAIIYAGIAETHIGPQLLAGVLPGVLVIATFTATLVLIALVWPRLVGRERNQRIESKTWAERWSLLRKAWIFPVIIIVVVASMATGFFTATEAGAAAALIAILAAIPRFVRARTGKPLMDALGATASSTGAIFFMIMGAAALSQLVTLSGLGRLFVDFVNQFDLNAVQFLLIMMVVYVILGTAMETLPMILMTVPILLPILDDLEISRIFFGVFIIIMCELGMLTPPVGALLYVTHRTAQHPSVNLGQKISVGDVMKAVYVIVPVTLLIVVALILFPELTLVVPNLMGAGG